MKIEISMDSVAVQRALNALGQRARNLSPAFREIGAGVADEARLGFKGSQDPYGRAWQPLKSSTLAARRKGKGSGSAKPLLDTGRLRNSISFELLGQSGVVIGTNVKYGTIHQFGGMAGRSRKVPIPARSFLATRERGIPREYGEIIRDALARHFAKAVA